MKRIAGMLFTVLGILYLMNPDFNIMKMWDFLYLFCSRYWPVFLVSIGIYLQSSSFKRKRSK